MEIGQYAHSLHQCIKNLATLCRVNDCIRVVVNMSLLEFRSKAAGGFFMMPQTFAGICEVLERPYSDSGCWLTEDLPGVIEKIEAHVAREKAMQQAMQEKIREAELKGKQVFMSYEDELEEENKTREQVSFAMRVFPLLEMLHAAVRKNEKVYWGVP